MTADRDNGGQAFPTPDVFDPRSDAPYTDDRIYARGCAGMSLRDWFAGQALIGILGSRNGFLVDVGTETAPSWAYQVADAMLKKRQENDDDR